MLQVNFIRENFEKAVEGLNKRNFPHAEELLSQVLEIDKKRKETQSERDQLQAEANGIAKEIGGLMKAGKKDEAEKVKLRTADIKSQIKTLESDYDGFEQELKELLYTIPNIPYTDVPTGTSAEDNEVVLQHGAIPSLYEGNQPHWELIKRSEEHTSELQS